MFNSKEILHEIRVLNHRIATLINIVSQIKDFKAPRKPRAKKQVPVKPKKD